MPEIIAGIYARVFAAYISRDPSNIVFAARAAREAVRDYVSMVRPYYSDLYRLPEGFPLD